MTTAFTVDGKTAIITGAGSGISLGFAKLLLSGGCNVLIADLALRAEARDVISRYSGKDQKPRAVWVKTDVTSWPDLDKMFATALEEFGDFDIVCPGAGVCGPLTSRFWHPPGCEVSKDDPDGGRYAALDINLTHPIRTTQIALSHWLYPRDVAEGSKFPVPAKVSAANPKRVIIMSSAGAQVPMAFLPIYCASKHALSGFVRSLAPLEALLGVRINAVAPGIAKTPLWMESTEILQLADLSKDVFVTVDEINEAMLKCLEKAEYPGGTILEVGVGTTRKVGVFNDPGPNFDPKSGMIMSKSHLSHGLIQGYVQDESLWGPRKQ